MKPLFGAVVSYLLLHATTFGAEPSALRVHPELVVLDRPEATEQVLVFGNAIGEQALDLTREVTYEVSDPSIAEILPNGRVLPRGDGRTRARVQFGPQSVSFEILVRGQASAPSVSFQHDVLPVLTKAGCNSGGCHGKAEGQNGFRLSVFGFDAAADHAAIAQEARGRRIQTAAPDQSLFLRKATAEVPHGGGRRIEPGSSRLRLLRRWIEEGARLDAAAPRSAVALRVEPEAVLVGPRTSQQLRVTLVAEDGGETCVTAEADYQSNADAIAEVDESGLVTSTEIAGEAAILVRYMGHVGIARVTQARSETPIVRPPEHNFIDPLVWDKLEQLGIQPSQPADDAMFHRRVFLDTIGTLPTPEETLGFLNNASPDKRQQLISQLLERPEYADYWAQKWADLLRVDRDVITSPGAVAMTRWLRRCLEDNISYDQFAREIVTAQGSTVDTGPAALFVALPEPGLLSRSISQLFLGVRIECAECHHHPFERWDQADYYALAGFFSGVQRTASPLGGQKIIGGPGQDLTNPRTGETVAAASLGAQPAAFADGQDRRVAFADWMTDPTNPFFTRTIVNRIWAHYLGRGLFEPVDDLRATNPAGNEPLLRALEQHLIENDYDLQSLTRVILESQVYQLSSEANESNRLDDRNYSRAVWKPLPAEVLLDAISAATDVPHEFDGLPSGYRAIEIWDNRLPSTFFRVFGRPERRTVCSCERGVEPSMAQALHLMNSPETAARLRSNRGRAARLAGSSLSDHELVEQLYLATLSRLPNDEEQQLMLSVIEEVSATGDEQARRVATEDILWTLLNTREFAFNH